MNPEEVSPSNEKPADFERPLSEYLRKIEAQGERMREASLIGQKINDLLGLISVADYTDEKARESRRQQEDDAVQQAWATVAEIQGTDVMTATHDLERYILQARRYDENFSFKVDNLPDDSYMTLVGSFHIIRDKVKEFLADDLDVRGRQGINLINRREGTQVMLKPVRHVKVIPVFDDTTEEE